MTSYTKVPDGEQSVITISPRHKISKIEDNTYGGFTESVDPDSRVNLELILVRHMGRCIYGGLYDPGNPLSDNNGFRKDVIEAFKELNCPVVRYPGGNFCATYHWQDGIGPKDKRPKRYVHSRPLSFKTSLTSV